MIRLPQSLNAWASPQFKEALKREIEAMSVDQLPLQQGLKMGSSVLAEKFSVLVLSVTDANEKISAKIGVLYKSIDAGCSCADDPTPVEAVNEYCELYLELDKQSGEAAFKPAD